MITTDTGFGEEFRETIKEKLPVMIIVENVASLDTAHDNVLEKTGYVKSG